MVQIPKELIVVPAGFFTTDKSLIGIQRGKFEIKALKNSAADDDHPTLFGVFFKTQLSMYCIRQGAAGGAWVLNQKGSSEVVHIFSRSELYYARLNIGDNFYFGDSSAGMVEEIICVKEDESNIPQDKLVKSSLVKEFC